jgi:hypothetical protein
VTTRGLIALWLYWITVAVVLPVVLAQHVGPPAPCPPFDQCTGSPATNHPRCNCWDGK